MIQQIHAGEFFPFILRILVKGLSRMMNQPANTVASMLGNIVALHTTDSPGCLSSIHDLVEKCSLTSSQKKELADDIFRLANLYPIFKEENVSSEYLHDVAAISIHLSSIFAQQNIPQCAYSLLEVAYNIKKTLEEPAYDIALKIMNCADINDDDQWAFALWIFAIEQVNYSVGNNCEWLEAFDAVEIAMAVRVSNNQAHQILAHALSRSLLQATGTKLSSLINAFILMGGVETNANEMKEIIKHLSDSQDEVPGDSEKKWRALKWQAMMNVQMDVDNQRFEFLRKSRRPAFAWHDFSLFHSQLEEAVPLGKSLFRDVSRTGEYVLDLSHEIAHAYSLLGAIGKSRNVLRIVIHSCELLLLNTSQSKNTDHLVGMKPMQHLSKDLLSATVAQIQLAAAWKALVLESVWLPWLEGVAMYFEMLSHPGQDKTEILSVYEAIRSLSDIDFDVRENEPLENFENRITEQVVSEFESFFAEAHTRYSKFRHTGYTYLPFGDNNKDEKDIYLMGYLLVRSIVSRWETTLGRQLVPIEAAKLLLYVTRGDGNEKMIPDLSIDIEQFAPHCRQRFISWLNEVGAFDKDTLSNFVRSVATHEKGRYYYWIDGKIYHSKSNSDDATRIMTQWIDKLKDQGLKVLAGAGIPLGVLQPDIVKRLQDTIETTANDISALIDLYWELQTLLPVGKTMAKINIPEEGAGKIMISARTYVGVPNNIKDDPEKRQRYSIRWLSLEGGAKEVEIIKKAMSSRRLARVSATRIIDLIGRSANPFGGSITSYVCFLIEKDWHHITAMSPTWLVKDDHREFKKLLIERVFPSIFFTGESSTLSSFHFLSHRLRELMGNEGIQGIPSDPVTISFSKEIIFEACGIAFDSNIYDLETAFAERSVENVSRIMGRYLYETGKGVSNLWKAFETSGIPKWAKIVGDPTAFSGIKAFKL